MLARQRAAWRECSDALKHLPAWMRFAIKTVTCLNLAFGVVSWPFRKVGLWVFPRTDRDVAEDASAREERDAYIRRVLPEAADILAPVQRRDPEWFDREEK